MRTRMFVVAVTLTALGLPGSPVAGAAPLPALAGTTVVSGSEIGAMRVRVPGDTRIRLNEGLLGERPSATFRGAGRTLAVILDRVGADDTTMFQRHHICMTRGCQAPGSEFGIRWVAGGSRLETTTIPAGTYDLYWVADGVPASVTLTLAGLPGRTTLRPPPLRARVWSPSSVHDTVEPSTSTGARVWEGSTETVLPKGGFALMVLAAWSDHIEGESLLCVYPAGTPTSVAQPCPSEGNRRRMSMVYGNQCPCPLGSHHMAMIWLADVDPGKYTVYGDARYVGTFGHVAATVAAFPLL